ncbi:hypothetical protein D3C73_1305560 [compost metagenome]
MAGIFHIASGVYGDEGCSAAHSLKPRQGAAVKNAGADKNIGPVIVVAELLIIERSEEAVFAGGLHLLQRIRAVELIRRTDEIDIYARQSLIDDVQLLYEVVLLAVPGEAVLDLVQNGGNVHRLLQPVADMPVAEVGADTHRDNAACNFVVQGNYGLLPFR